MSFFHLPWGWLLHTFLFHHCSQCFLTLFASWSVLWCPCISSSRGDLTLYLGCVVYIFVEETLDAGCGWVLLFESCFCKTYFECCVNMSGHYQRKDLILIVYAFCLHEVVQLRSRFFFIHLKLKVSELAMKGKLILHIKAKWDQIDFKTTFIITI